MLTKKPMENQDQLQNNMEKKEYISIHDQWELNVRQWLQCLHLILLNESHYIYIDNIPGVISHKEVTACQVNFKAAEYMRNSITCAEEQEIQIHAGGTFIPICKSINYEYYDGCQCDIGNDKWTRPWCFCCDKFGNKILDEAMYIENGMTWEQVCVQELNCADITEVTYTQSKNTIKNPSTLIRFPQFVSVITGFVITILIMAIMLLRFYLKAKSNYQQVECHEIAMTQTI
eukprot:214243_1